MKKQARTWVYTYRISEIWRAEHNGSKDDI